MYTRGKDWEQPGKFEYCLFDENNNLVERRGGFDTHSEADRAAEQAQRALLFPARVYSDSDDDLLKALGL